MLTKASVRAWLEQNFFLRVHMTLILGGTFLAGLITTRLLMDAGVNRLALRYLAAVAAAYFIFLVLIRLWLAYVGSGGQGYDFTGDGIETCEQFVPSPRFKGGGSSGSWGSVDLNLGGDADDLVVIVLLVVIVICLAGFAIYFIYTAPALLSEAAFEAALAASLVRQTRNASCGWMGLIFRKTALPFALVLALSGVLGWVEQKRCPAARRLREAISCAKSPQPPEVAAQVQ
jgi:hypothetical protein